MREIAHSEKQKLRDEAKARDELALSEKQKMQELALSEKQKMRDEAKAREEANLKREQSYMQAELKRKEIETVAATETQKQQIDAIFKMQAIERREIERYQEKEKELLERELHTRMELEKQLAAEKQEILRLQYEAKTRSLEQQLKDKSQLLFTTQENVQTRVVTPSCDTMESSSCAPSVSQGFTQSLFQGPPPLFASSLLSARQLDTNMSQALPTLALSATVQPTPAAVPSAFGTQPSFGYGAPQVTQSIGVTAVQTTLPVATCNAIASSATTQTVSVPVSNVTSGATYPSVMVSMPPATTITAAAEATAQANAGPAFIQTTSAPVVIVKQPQPVKPYTGQTSYKGFKEYFTRLALCNGWTTQIEKAQNLLVAMEGAAAEAVRGFTVTQDSDYDAIWEALARRFGHMDEPERAMRLFDVAKQAEHESLAQFEQNLRTLYREAWPGSDTKSKDADSVLQRRFVGGILDAGLQQYLRLHARTDDFSTTVTKARQYVEAQNLAKVTKKPAIRMASSVELDQQDQIQPILDGLQQVLQTVLEGQNKQVATQNSNTGTSGRSGSRKNQGNRLVSPAPSDSSAASQSSNNRRVQFRDDAPRRNGYRASDEPYPRQGSNFSDRFLGNRGDRAENFRDNRDSRQDRASRPINRGNQGYQGQRGDNQDRRQEWRTSSAGSQTRQTIQDNPRRQQNSRATPEDSPPFRGSNNQENRRPQDSRLPFRGLGRCWVCNTLGCHSDFHGERAEGPQRFSSPGPRGAGTPDRPNTSTGRGISFSREPSPQSGSAARPQSSSNWQRGSRQGDRTPPYNSPSRPHSQ